MRSISASTGCNLVNVCHKSIDACIVSQKVIMVQLIRSTHFISIEMREEKKE